jgi:predicted amidophosphoribosyltransferase
MLDTGSRIPFCRACLTTLTQELSQPQCARCVRPIVSTAVSAAASPPQCRLCRLGTYDFDFVRSFGAYSPAMARAILLLKYTEITPLGVWFANHLVKLAK